LLAIGILLTGSSTARDADVVDARVTVRPIAVGCSVIRERERVEYVAISQVSSTIRRSFKARRDLPDTIAATVSVTGTLADAAGGT